ncbi:SENP2 protease, partial [Balaeniceps rex]|nr:SENP2 protease [Balaeniceps rex]
QVINFYMSLLVERNKKEGYPAVHAFSTFFYPKLISGGYKAVIDVRKKTIKYFDSMGQKRDNICATLFQYLQEESRDKRNLELTFSEWTLHSMESHEIPQQLNGSDCGVFMCKYADYISRDKPITFTQNHMPYFRRKMVWEIIHQQLL